MRVIKYLIPILVSMHMCINPIVKSQTYDNKLLHMCSNNYSIKQIDNNKICERCENTVKGLIFYNRLCSGR